MLYTKAAQGSQQNSARQTSRLLPHAAAPGCCHMHHTWPQRPQHCSHAKGTRRQLAGRARTHGRSHAKPAAVSAPHTSQIHPCVNHVAKLLNRSRAHWASKQGHEQTSAQATACLQGTIDTHTPDQQTDQQGSKLADQHTTNDCVGCMVRMLGGSDNAEPTPKDEE